MSERARAVAAAASHARAEHNTKRERGNTRSPEWQFRASDGQRAKVGTSGEGGRERAVAPHTYRFIRFYSSPLRLPRSTTSKTRRAREREKGIENNGRSIPGAIGRRSLVRCQNQEQARIITDESRRPIHKGKSERVFDAQVKRGREIGDREGDGE